MCSSQGRYKSHAARLSILIKGGYDLKRLDYATRLATNFEIGLDRLKKSI
ncbi:MAG: hypothetical protein HOO03_01785 [Rhodobacteraceae bacterium]|nr:hypothetical protein [Paracoccaceae bacterium]MDG1299819.1 hypothetical protein [Paracoccaceae bacterium]